MENIEELKSQKYHLVTKMKRFVPSIIYSLFFGTSEEKAVAKGFFRWINFEVFLSLMFISLYFLIMRGLYDQPDVISNPLAGIVAILVFIGFSAYIMNQISFKYDIYRSIFQIKQSLFERQEEKAPSDMLSVNLNQLRGRLKKVVSKDLKRSSPTYAEDIVELQKDIDLVFSCIQDSLWRKLYNIKMAGNASTSQTFQFGYNDLYKMIDALGLYFYGSRGRVSSTLGTQSLNIFFEGWIEYFEQHEKIIFSRCKEKITNSFNRLQEEKKRRTEMIAPMVRDSVIALVSATIGFLLKGNL